MECKMQGQSLTGDFPYTMALGGVERCLVIPKKREVVTKNYSTSKHIVDLRFVLSARDRKSFLWGKKAELIRNGQ